MRIALPEITMLPGAKAHPYPLRIGFQTIEFLHAATFHAAFTDVAAGERVRQPGAFNEIRDDWVARGLDAGAWQTSWDLLQKYSHIFESSTYQSVTVALRSHWDWYVRHLGAFVIFARQHVSCPTLTSKEQETLGAVGRKEFTKQLHLLQGATGVNLLPSQDAIDSIVLMTHVRNLGLHNRWEVDQDFLTSHPSCGLQVGDLRTVSSSELETWAEAMRSAVKLTLIEIAKWALDAPHYE